MTLKNTLCPVLFIGHGTPMNAIEDNRFSREWGTLAKSIPKPKAVLCISAHWETQDTFVTAMPAPRTIHDFGGFPDELYQVSYRAPGSKWLAQETKNCISSVSVGFDLEWGLDHGCWSVLKNMYPKADVPIVELSMDFTQPAQFHYNLGKELLPLREMGVLIIGSGNMVHNLRKVSVRGEDFNEPSGYDWAIEANDLFKKLIVENDHEKLIDYPLLGEPAQMAIPTPDHYLPMLYALSLQKPGETVSFFNDEAVAGSLTMTSFTIGI